MPDLRAAAGCFALTAVVIAGSARLAAAPQNPDRRSETETCKALVANARQQADRGDTTGADRALTAAARQCPNDGSLWRELAAVRVRASRWKEAEHPALRAVHVAPTDEQAWRLLATSRYMSGDFRGALAAWNHVGEPRIGAIDIHGARNTRHGVVANLAGLQADQLLTPGAFLRATHRVELLPVSFDTRLKYEPLENGRARVDVLLDERDVVPRSWLPLVVTGGQALILGELKVEVAGPTGSGEDWTGAWRWSESWQRVTLGLATPAPGRLPGVLSVDGLWEAQSYALGEDFRTRETRRHVGVGLSDWATSWLRWDAGGAADQFGVRDYAALSGALEARVAKDHMSLGLGGGAWTPLSGGPAFGIARLTLAVRTTTKADHAIVSLISGGSLASDGAPLALWPAAGSTFSRDGLLRAHGLRTRGTMTGEAFGRQLAYGTLEYQRPAWRSPAGPLAVAVFVDAAQAWHRAASLGATPLIVDVGAGVRVRAPAVAGVIRLDVARGLRDGRMKASLGLVQRWPSR